MRQEDGFSSLEMIIAAIIITTSISITLPKLNSSDYFLIKNEALYLSNKLRYMQAIGNIVTSNDNLSNDTILTKAPYLLLRENKYMMHLFDKKSISKEIVHYLPRGMKLYSSSTRRDYYFNKETVNNNTITLEKGNEKIFIVVDIIGRIRITDHRY